MVKPPCLKPRLVPPTATGPTSLNWDCTYRKIRTGFGANVAKQISGLGLILDLKIYISLKFPAPCQLQISQHMQNIRLTRINPM